MDCCFLGYDAVLSLLVNYQRSEGTGCLHLALDPYYPEDRRCMSLQSVGDQIAQTIAVKY
jgi:hypothetical protein